MHGLAPPRAMPAFARPSSALTSAAQVLMAMDHRRVMTGAAGEHVSKAITPTFPPRVAASGMLRSAAMPRLQVGASRRFLSGPRTRCCRRSCWWRNSQTGEKWRPPSCATLPRAKNEVNM